MIPQHIIYGVGGTVHVDSDTRPTAATVKIVTGGGTTLVDSTAATLSTINTTLSSAAALGARTVAVASAVGIAAGTEVVLSGPVERVRVKSISGTDVTLFRPLLSAHASGTDFVGARVSYTVLAASADSLFHDGRCEWSFDSALAYVTSVECTKYPLTYHEASGESSIYDEIPNLDLMLSEGDDPQSLRRKAHEAVLERIGGQGRMRLYTGGEGFQAAVDLAFAMQLYRRRPGDSAQEMYSRYKEEMIDAISRLQDFVPRDKNQDGRVDEKEKLNMRSVRVLRA